MKRLSHYKNSSIVIALFMGMTACSNDKVNSDTIDITPTSPPNTDLYLANITFTDEIPSISEPMPIAFTNGYENQPFFLPRGAGLLYTAQGASGKTDIWRYGVFTGRYSQITNTPDRSEYSPRLMPNRDSIAFIQENIAGDHTQLYKTPTTGNEGKTNETQIIDFAPLGYYAFLGDEENAFVFYRSEPPTLHKVNIASGENTEIASNIGRPLHAATNKKGLYFTVSNKDKPYTLKFYDDISGDIKTLFALAGPSEEFINFPLTDNKGTGFLTANGGIVYYRTDAPTDQWQQIADLSADGLNDISRLAISDDKKKIAIVTSLD